jgi:hypothetical protein
MAAGFLVAASAGALFLSIAAFADPLVREAELDAIFGRFLTMLEPDGEPLRRLAALGYVFRSILIFVCAAPLALAALIGEIAGVRAWIWFAGASGCLAAASPWIVRGGKTFAEARPPGVLELRVEALLFLTGALTGTIYWLIAARKERSASIP